MDWSTKTDREILNGRNAKGTPYLSLFLLDYKELTGVRTVNAGCASCIMSYIREYKLKTQTMSKTKTKFKVKKKYLGAPIGFNTGKFIQNIEPTDEEVALILERHKPEVIFDVYPKDLDADAFMKKHYPNEEKIVKGDPPASKNTKDKTPPKIESENKNEISSELAEEYEKVFGKRVYYPWGAEKVQKMIDDEKSKSSKK